MSYVHKTEVIGTSSGAIIDLRAVGDTTSSFNRVGYLKITAIALGAASADVLVKPIVVPEGAAVPAAPSANPLPVSGPSDYAELFTAATAGSTDNLELGQLGSQGSNSANQSNPVATHLLVWCLAGCDFRIVGQ